MNSPWRQGTFVGEYLDSVAFAAINERKMNDARMASWIGVLRITGETEMWKRVRRLCSEEG